MDTEVKRYMYFYPEYFAFLNAKYPGWQNMKRADYCRHDCRLWLEFAKERREAYKQTLHYKMYKAGQALRILFKLIIRSLFKIKL